MFEERFLFLISDFTIQQGEEIEMTMAINLLQFQSETNIGSKVLKLFMSKKNQTMAHGYICSIIRYFTYKQLQISISHVIVIVQNNLKIIL